MADKNAIPPDPAAEPAKNWEPHALPPELPVPADPGGARAKGYSADPRPEAPAPAEGPIPLADVPAGPSRVRKPDGNAALPPTGRDEPGGVRGPRASDG